MVREEDEAYRGVVGEEEEAYRKGLREEEEEEAYRGEVGEVGEVGEEEEEKGEEEDEKEVDEKKGDGLVKAADCHPAFATIPVPYCQGRSSDETEINLPSWTVEKITAGLLHYLTSSPAHGKLER